VACDYRAELHYDDWFDVEAHVARVGRTSWTMDFTMHSLPARDSTIEEGIRVGEGQMIVVLSDQHTGHPVPLPDDLRQALTPV